MALLLVLSAAWRSDTLAEPTFGQELLMPGTSFANRENLTLIEDYYRRWLGDPASVDERWQAFLEGFELAGRIPSTAGDPAQSGIMRLIFAYRDLGHFQ